MNKSFTKKTKIIISVFTMILLLGTFTGCSGLMGENVLKNWDKDGKLINFKLEDIDPDSAALYISPDKVKINMLLPVQPDAHDNGFKYTDQESSELENSSSESVNTQATFNTISLQNKDVLDFDKLILSPKKDPLIANVPTEEYKEESLFAKKYDDFGYSFGAVFSISEDGNDVYLDPSKANDNSDIKEVLQKANLDGDGLLHVTKINGKAFPIELIDARTGFLPKLDKQAIYELSIEKGSKRTTINTIADTKILAEPDVSIIESLVYGDAYTDFLSIDTNNLSKGYWVLEPFNQLMLVM
jgi:hypothetical protein